MAFSVLMSVYQKEKPEYLEQALDSVIKQTLPPNEIVLIEDGILTEALYQVIEEKKKVFPELRTYQFKENVQLGRALAKGVELCKYELIARMDTDDIALEKRFELQYTYMEEHPEVAVSGGWMEEFSSDDENYRKVKTMPETMEEIVKYARYRNPINHMTAMFRKSVVLEAGNYRHFPYLEDYDLWVRMLASGKIINNINQVLVKSRINRSLYNRRGGMQYFKQYRKLRINQKNVRMLNEKEYINSLFLTAVMTLQPIWLRKLLYQKILREKKWSK